MKTEQFVINGDNTLDQLIRLLKRLDIKEPCTVTIDYGKKRTVKQNGCYWAWLTGLARALNEAGFSLNDNKVIKLDVPFTKDNLHENACKPYLNALWPDMDSSTELSTTEMQELYQYVDQAISSRTGVHVEWPDRWSHEL